MMQDLEESIGEMVDVLMAMPREELRRLEKNTQQLTPEQTDFVRFTLESARRGGRLPTYQLGLLEYFFESWWTHGVATKLAVIDRVIQLSNGRMWPGDIPLRRAMVESGGDDRGGNLPALCQGDLARPEVPNGCNHREAAEN